MGKKVGIPKSFDLFHPIRRGSAGKKVRLVQELLCVNGFNIVIDGKFGPATQHSVCQFQAKRGLKVDGIVFEITFRELLIPLENVTREIPVNNRSAGEMVAAYAKQHLEEHPREVGGQNKGPWVRLYMNGNEGHQWPWCAGFVSFILKQTFYNMGKDLPFKTSFSCDLLATYAMEKGRFLRGFKVENQRQVKPGVLFLSRRSPTDWVHTGIVTGVDFTNGIFYTIEGNTNDEGSREGYEVCTRTRAFTNKDFLLIE